LRIASCAATIIGTCEVSRTPLRKIERAERRDGGAQRIHRVRPLHHLQHVVDRPRQHARGLQLLVERGKRVARRQLALQKQIARFLERRVLGEVVDRVAAVAQLARAPVDEAHARAVEVDVLQPAPDFDLVLRLAHGSLTDDIFTISFLPLRIR
jgi:hypothetical protein